MEFMSSLYPALSDRKALPAFYTPSCFVLAILPFLIHNKRLVGISTFPILLYLCITWPCFTAGDPSSDYYNNSHFVAFPLWYLDFAILTPRDGQHAPALVKPRAGSDPSGDGEVQYQQWKDLSSSVQRIQWAFRLMIPGQRGIGWNWQVKGVCHDPYANLSKWQFVQRHFCWAVVYYLQSVVALTVLGFAHTLKEQLEPHRQIGRATATALLGWSGAWWVWDRLSCAYSLAAMLFVATGLTGIWEWPPLMGPLQNAWSVHQMWSATYHQVCRRLLSKPAARIVGLLRLPKGSLVSGYSQLFLTFGFSCLFHQAQMFNVTRRDMGEFSFFMSQPLAIVFEDLACWMWKRARGRTSKARRFERVVGYLWTFTWFAFSLPLYIDGLIRAEIIKDWVFGNGPLQIGAEAVHRLPHWLGT